jgi:hypothetical protein
MSTDSKTALFSPIMPNKEAIQKRVAGVIAIYLVHSIESVESGAYWMLKFSPYGLCYTVCYREGWLQE